MEAKVEYRVWAERRDAYGLPGVAVLGIAQGQLEASAVGRFLLRNEIPSRVEFVVWNDVVQEAVTEIGRNMDWSDAKEELPGGPVKREGWDIHIRAVRTENYNAVNGSYVDIGPNRYRMYTFRGTEELWPYVATDADRHAKDWCWA